MSLQDASAEMTRRGRPVHWATLYRVQQIQAAAGVVPGSPTASSSTPAPEPPPVVAPSGPAIPAAQLEQLRGVVGRLPLAQQDALLVGLPLDRLRSHAIAAALGPHHEAARDVAAALRGLDL